MLKRFVFRVYQVRAFRQAQDRLCREPFIFKSIERFVFITYISTLIPLHSAQAVQCQNKPIFH